MRSFSINLLLFFLFSYFSVSHGKVKPIYNAESIDKVIQIARGSRTLKEFILKQNPKESPRRQFLLKYIKKHRLWKVPLMQRKKNVIDLKSDGFSAQLKIINDQKGFYRLNGHDLKFSQEEKAEERIQKMTQILKLSKQKLNSVLQVFLPKASAIVGWIAVGAIAVTIEELVSDFSLYRLANGETVILQKARCEKSIRLLMNEIQNLTPPQKGKLSQMGCTRGTVILSMNMVKEGPRSADTILSINRDQKMISEHNRETGEFIQYVQDSNYKVQTVRYKSNETRGKVYNEGDRGFDELSRTYRDYGRVYQKVYEIASDCSCEDIVSVLHQRGESLKTYEESFGGDFLKRKGPSQGAHGVK